LEWDGDVLCGGGSQVWDGWGWKKIMEMGGNGADFQYRVTL